MLSAVDRRWIRAEIRRLVRKEITPLVEDIVHQIGGYDGATPVVDDCGDEARRRIGFVAEQGRGSVDG